MTARIQLKDAFKKFTHDQDKVIDPSQTVAEFKERLRQVDLDILQEVRRIDNGRLDIPVFFSTCGRDAVRVIGTRKQMGKGGTPSQAEASAVMELAERFSFFSFVKNPDNFTVDSYRNLQGKQALSFNAIAKSVQDYSEDIKIAASIFENIPMKWTWGFNLTRNEPVLVPFDWFFAINEFNGPSAGNCTEEALSQGICEVVERHVSSVVSHNRMAVPAIDPNSVTDPLVLEMLNKYEKAGIRLFLSDFSLDIGIPTVGAMAYDPDTFPHKSEIVWTAGTTPHPEKALSRALTEVAQLAGDFNTGSNYVASGLPKFKRLEDADFIMNPVESIRIGDLPDLSDTNIKKEVENCIDALSGKGFEVIVIETTHPLLKIPAFYTIIPGAQFRERAQNTSVGMFSAKLIAESEHPIKALKELQKIDTKLPGKYYIQFYMGYCSLQTGDTLNAIDYFQKALDLDPKTEDRISIYSYLGFCLKEIGRYEEALKFLEIGESLDADRTDILNLMGFCYFKLKKHELAIESFRKILNLDPSSAIDYANIASNYREMGQKDLAIRYYQTALELDPTIEFAQENLIKLINKGG